MEFEVLQRKVDVRWDHIWLYLGVLLGLVILMSVPGYLYYELVMKGDPTAYSDYMLTISSLLAVVSAPISAFLFLRFSGVFKLERNVEFCRSMAGAGFFVLAALSLLSFLMGIWFGFNIEIGLDDFIGLAGTFAGLAASSIIMYLWMLLWLLPKAELKDTWQKAVLFTAIFLFLEHGALFLYNTHVLDMVYAPSILSLGFESILSIAGLLLFAFILFYHMPKKLNQAAYLFASLYLGSSVLYLVNAWIFNQMGSLFIDLGGLALGLIEDAISLVIIYFISRYMGQANL